MTSKEPAEARIAQLREQIVADLDALRGVWTNRVRNSGRSAAEWTTRASRLRGLPTWTIGAAAGLFAGLWSALRGRKRPS